MLVYGKIGKPMAIIPLNREANPPRAAVVLPTGAQAEWESMTRDPRVLVVAPVPPPNDTQRAAIEADMRRHGATQLNDADAMREQLTAANIIARKELLKLFGADNAPSEEQDKPKRRKITLDVDDTA